MLAQHDHEGMRQEIHSMYVHFHGFQDLMILNAIAIRVLPKFFQMVGNLEHQEILFVCQVWLYECVIKLLPMG